MDTETTYRLNKFVSNSGVTSRRKAADLVKAGKIKVNGEVEVNPAVIVTEKDIVEYEGKVLNPIKNLVYLLLNKPKGVVTTMEDEQGRKTVWNIVESKVKERIFPIGRLDMYTTGLLLLTNDGDLTQKLSHPSHKVKKIYQVSLSAPLSEEDKKAIEKGILLDDGVAEVDGISYVSGEDKTEIGLEIHMGKNRVIRRIFESLNYRIERLDRVYYAGLTKKDLPRGWSRFLSEKEIIMLKHFTNTPHSE